MFFVEPINKIFNLFITTIAIKFKWFAFDRGWHTLLVLLFLGLFIFQNTVCNVRASKVAAYSSTRRACGRGRGSALETTLIKPKQKIKIETESCKCN